jgi:CheY-like chemotaxis protein
MNKRSVLYVEDEEDDVLFMRRAFGQVGLDAIINSVGDGHEALSFLQQESLIASTQPVPDLILLDLNLPRVSGFEVLTWIRQQGHLRSVPVVIFSSSDADDDRDRARSLGATDYVVKPASGSHFVDVARELRRRFLESEEACLKQFVAA